MATHGVPSDLLWVAANRLRARPNRQASVPRANGVVFVNDRAIYDELGVTPIINAAGTFTRLGGSLMSSEVVAAWSKAAGNFVDVVELQDKVGARISELLDVEAAMVTGGAAAGILLGTAAAITRHDASFITRQPLDERPFEVLRRANQRDPYDRQATTCGVRIVDVETLEEAEAKHNEHTVMTMAYNVYEPESQIRHDEWLAFARNFSIPTLLDAAADTPPVANLSALNHLGYDMVVFSGGKAIRGPQGTGLLLGRQEFIELAKQNASPNEGVIGRVAKVSKEDMVALWKAVELFVEKGDSLLEQCQQRIAILCEMLRSIPTLSIETLVPAVANHFPHLLLHWDQAQLGVDAAELRRQLWTGSPRIATDRVYGTGNEGFLISVVNLQPGEETIVAQRVKEILSGQA